MSSLSPDDFRVLSDPAAMALVEKHRTDDPTQLAFRLKCGREQARLVCRQVKYLQRAKTKLPAYCAAGCIIPPLAYEQCSSEAAATTKAYSGRLCIDLTGGLGVDSFYFSKTFGDVITVERDPVLAEVARFNFNRLGVRNIQVENTSAEVFLNRYTGPKADLIYIDPARRSAGERVFLLEDCSPDVIKLMPSLLQRAERVLVKLSPLFDVTEALRVFGRHASKLEIVSVGGEVKELLAELTENPGAVTVAVNLTGGNRFTFTPEDISLAPEETLSEPAFAGYLLIPDAAFYKGRLVKALIDRYFAENKIILPAKNGFAFAGKQPEDFPGRTYRILGTMDYQPKQLKKRLKEQRIGRINILRRNFPHKSEEIKRSLGVQEGGTEWFAFTEIDGKSIIFRVEPVFQK